MELLLELPSKEMKRQARKSISFLTKIKVLWLQHPLYLPVLPINDLKKKSTHKGEDVSLCERVGFFFKQHRESNLMKWEENPTVTQ